MTVVITVHLVALGSKLENSLNASVNKIVYMDFGIILSLKTRVELRLKFRCTLLNNDNKRILILILILRNKEGLFQSEGSKRVITLGKVLKIRSTPAQIMFT